MQQQINQALQNIIHAVNSDHLQFYHILKFSLHQILESLNEEILNIQQFYSQQIENLQCLLKQKQLQIIKLKSQANCMQNKIFPNPKNYQQTPYKNLITKINKQNINNSESQPISDQKHNTKYLNMNKQPQNRLSLQNHQHPKQSIKNVRETQVHTVAGQDLPILIHQKNTARNRSNTTFCKTLSNEFQFLQQCSRQDFDYCLTSRNPKMINSLQSYQGNQHKSIKTKLYRKPQNKYKKGFERKKYMQQKNITNLLEIPIKIITNVKINLN